MIKPDTADKLDKLPKKQLDSFVGSEYDRLLQKMLAIQIFGTKHLKYAPNPS